MIFDYLRFTITREEKGFSYTASFDFRELNIRTFGSGLSVRECLSDALLFAMRNRVRKTPTTRNLFCLAKLCEGLDAYEIAALMGVKYETVIYHLQQVRARLGAKNDAEAVFIALALGYLSPYFPDEVQKKAMQNWNII